MKKFIIIILTAFLTAGPVKAQESIFPDSYKLSKTGFKVYNGGEFDRKPTNVTANPVKSKYPVSNSIIRMLKQGDTVWFQTGSGIMRTTDRFNSFDSYYGVEPFGTQDICGLAILNNVIVVSTLKIEELNNENIQTGTGLKISTDYGVHWNSVGQPVDGRYDTVLTYGSNQISVLPMVVPQQNVSFDIAITRTKNDLNNYTIWIASWGGTLRKSTDYGNSWQRVLLPPDNLDSIVVTQSGYTFGLHVLNNKNQTPFSIKALNDSTIFVGTANGINKSTDWGLSWRKYNYQNGGPGIHKVSGDFVVNLHIQKAGGKDIIWGACKRAEDNNEVNAISYTTDYGLTWAYTLKDINPRNISSRDSTVFAESDEGLWRSRLGIFDWSKPSLIYDEITRDVIRAKNFYSGINLNDTLYFGSADGMGRTIDIGNSWSGKWKIFRAVKAIDLSSDKKTYAAPNPFAPNYEVARIFYKTGKATSKITIKVFDFGMNPVRTVIQNAVRNSADELFTIWDGKNNEGYQVANGVYFYRIEVDSDEPVWGKILVIQ